MQVQCTWTCPGMRFRQSTLLYFSKHLRSIHGDSVRRGRRERGSSGYPSFVATMSAVSTEKDAVSTHNGSTQKTPQPIQVLPNLIFAIFCLSFLWVWFQMKWVFLLFAISYNFFFACCVSLCVWSQFKMGVTWFENGCPSFLFGLRCFFPPSSCILDYCSLYWLLLFWLGLFEGCVFRVTRLRFGVNY